MGWSGGGRIFDDVCETVLYNDNIADEYKTEILLALAKGLEDQDWRDYHECEYIDHPVVREVFYDVYGWEPDDD